LTSRGLGGAAVFADSVRYSHLVRSDS